LRAVANNGRNQNQPTDLAMTNRDFFDRFKTDVYAFLLWNEERGIFLPPHRDTETGQLCGEWVELCHLQESICSQSALDHIERVERLDRLDREAEEAARGFDLFGPTPRERALSSATWI